MSSSVIERQEVRAKQSDFHRDVISVAERAMRSIPRDLQGIIPALVFLVFFFVTIGAMQSLIEQAPRIDYKAFQLPVAIIFTVTGISRAVTLVTDIQTGYFDRLTLTPVNHLALLLDLMVADLALVVALTLPVVVLGFIVGVEFESGFAGMLVFILISSIWGLAYTGFPYAIALKTGGPAAVNSSFLLLMPFVFMTTIYLPQDQMTGWFATIVTYNPVTYLLAALRSLISDGWDWTALAKRLGATGGVALVSMTMALMSLRGRARRS
jgi:ABC-2 type transport system permease protein